LRFSVIVTYQSLYGIPRDRELYEPSPMIDGPQSNPRVRPFGQRSSTGTLKKNLVIAVFESLQQPS
jgi:hypothetical protein